MHHYGRRLRLFISVAIAWSLVTAAMLSAQAPPAQAAGAQAQSQAANGDTTGPAVEEFPIGLGDQLSVTVWREPDLSASVVVRPDGKISLPLINEVSVLGLTTQELRAKVTELLSQYHDNPTVSIVVTQINSRKVFITGMVAKPGEYHLLAPTTVIQLIAMAGGLLDFADKEHITVIRTAELRPDGVPWAFEVNYDDITKRRNLRANILLEPGDTVIVR